MKIRHLTAFLDRARIAREIEAGGARWPSGQLLAALLLIVVAQALMTGGLANSIWIDEAWVANSVLSQSLDQMFYYPNWLQITPPLNLLAVRGVTRILGVTELTLRLVAWLSVFLSAVLLYLAVARLFPSSPAGIVVTTLFFASPYLNKHGQQVKPFATDVLVTALILFLIAKYLNSPRTSTRTQLLCISVLALPLSYTTVFVAPSVLFALLISATAARRDNLPVTRRRPLLAAILCWGMVFGVTGMLLWRFFILPNQSPGLQAFWLPSYFDLNHCGQSLLGFWLAASGTLVPSAKLGLLPPAVFAAITLAGYILLFGRRGDETCSRPNLGVIGLLPLIAALCAGIVRVYPVRESPRLWLWYLPLLLLPVAAVFDRAWHWASSLSVLPPRLHRRMPAVVYATCLILTVACGVALRRVGFFREDHREACSHLKAHARGSGLLFVGAGFSEPFRFYRDVLNLNCHKVAVGLTGAASGGRWTSPPPAYTHDGFLQELIHALAAAESKRVWTYLPSEQHPYLPRPPEWMIRRSVLKQGWHLLSRAEFTSVEILCMERFTAP